MSEVAIEVDRGALRQRLRALLAKVPPSVLSGSYQKAVAFKKWHAEATKVANSDRATAAQLQSLINQASSYQ